MSSQYNNNNNNNNNNNSSNNQTIPEQHIGKARNQWTTEYFHISHCTHTAENTDVKVQNIFKMRINVTFSTNCKYRTAVTLYTLEIRFVTGIYSRVSFCDGSFYDDSLLRPVTTNIPDLWCITVATQAFFLYSVRFHLFSGVHVFLLILF